MRDAQFLTKLRVFLGLWRWRKSRRSSQMRARLRQWMRGRLRCAPSLKLRTARPASLFTLEPLESRLLLAADLTGVVGATTLIDPAVPTNAASAVVQVQNIGNQNAPGSQVGVYASLDATLGAGDVLLGMANTTGLTVGQSRNVTVGLTVPNSLTPGSYTLLAKVDNANAIAENSEANNVAIGGTINVAWQFGNVPGRSGSTTLTLRDADGTNVRFSLSGPGLGGVIRDGANWDVKVTGTTASSAVTITTNSGGNGRVTLNDIHVLGPLAAFTAATTNLTGTLAIDGPVTIPGVLPGTVTLGSIQGGTVAVSSVEALTILGSATNAKFYVGTTLGQDGQPGGTGANTDTYGAGSIGLFTVTGAMTGTTVRVGIDPVDGIYGNGNDTLIGGTNSAIGGIVIGGSLSADTRFMAGRFPTQYLNGLTLKPTAGDFHFISNFSGPSLNAAMQQDTGTSNSDRLTNNSAITGSVTDPQGIATFLAGFGATPTFNVLADRQPDGSFRFSQARLEQINGGPLADGPLTLTLSATDTVGNATHITVPYTLDTQVPVLTLDLDPASDTAPVGDQQTTNDVVTLVGQTEANAIVELVGLGLTTTADETGAFTFNNVVLALGANTFTARATDAAGNQRTELRTITRVAANSAPVLNTIGNQTIGEETPLTFTATASDGDVPAQALTFSLADGVAGQVPVGASIDSSTGVFTWTPTESQGPGTYTFDVVVTDSGSPNLSDSETITVTVNEVNQVPTLAAISSQNVTAGQLLTFTAVGSDADVPANTLTYSLQGTVPAGTVIDPITGLFTWSPTNAQTGPQSVTVRVTDNGTPSLFAEQVVSISVASANQAPTAVDDAYTIVQDSTLLSGTILVKDIFPGAVTSNLSQFTDVNGTLFFTAQDGVNGIELWKSDGTAAGTVLVKDLHPGTSSSNLRSLTNVNGTLFFTLVEEVDPVELWKSDGTDAGTVLVSSINSAGVSPNIQNLTNVNGTLYFTANDGVNGAELWKSDGTAAGTVLVKDILTGGTGSSPGHFTDVNGTLFFAADDGMNGLELWKSDGTAAGTVLVKDVHAGIGTSNLQLLTNVDGTLFFKANDQVNGFELWKSDGTTAGTMLVKDIRAGGPSSNPGLLTNVNGTLFFAADDGVNGVELWKSDGTDAGTVLVKDIRPGGTTSSPGLFTNMNGVLFFIANDGVNGRELWKSDGTAAGTVLVKDILAGGIGSSPGFLTNVNGTLFFAANDGLNGRELWKSDGTAAGTMLVKDIQLGSSSSDPLFLTNVNGTLFFRADNAADGVPGDELWASGTAANLLANDTDPESNPLTALLVSGPSNGALTLNSDGTFVYRPNAGFVGTDSFTYKANDGSLDSNVATVTITVTAAPVVNRPPVLTAIGNQTATEGQQLTFTATATDADAGQTLTFSLQDTVPAGANIDSSTGVFTWTPTEAQGPGTFTFDVVVTDNGAPALSDSETITVTVNEVNQAPTLAAIPNQSVTAGQLLTFTAVGSDADVPANTLTHSLQGTVPAGAVIDPITGVFMWTPTAGQVGPQNVTIRVTDNGTPSLFDEETITITVNQVNELPTLSINDVRVIEGDSGSVNALFTVTLSAESGQTVTVVATTANGTATANSDYTPIPPFLSLLTFMPGETAKTIVVPVLGDVVSEGDETFAVNLFSPDNSVIADGQGIGTILNDDGTSNLSINDVTITEGDSGSIGMTFTVTRSGELSGTTSVNFTTADGTATAEADYVATNGTLTFAPNVTSQTITVSVLGDLLPEPSDFLAPPIETFTVNLSSPTDGVIVDGQGVGTITDNEPRVFINDVVVTEGDSGTVNAVFTVMLSTTNSQTVTVEYATADGTPSPAVAGSDYVATNGTLTFAPNVTSQTITVPVLGNLLNEASGESFVVNLTNAVNAAISDDQGEGRVLDNDPFPSLSINDMTVAEGDSGSVDAVFTVTLSAASGQMVTVEYLTDRLNDVSFEPATPGADYMSVAGQLTFAPGQTTQTISVPVLGDLLDEGDLQNERFFVNLSTSSFASIADGQGLGMIIDNDPVPSLLINDVTVIEGDSGTVNAVFTVSLSAPSGQIVVFQVMSANGTATANSDYTPVSQLFTFTPGPDTGATFESAVFVVPVLGDTLSEGDETFAVNISFADRDFAVIADGHGIGTIVDDDGMNQSPTAVNDSFTVQQNSTLLSGTTLVKDLLLGAGSSNPTDLVNVSGTLYFAANEGVGGAELWKSDGTPAGTVLLKDNIGASNLTNVNGTLYFTAGGGVLDNQLWKTMERSQERCWSKTLRIRTLVRRPWLT